MPRIDAAEFESLPVESGPMTRGYDLHDVWAIDLVGREDCSIPALRGLITAESFRSVGPLVRGLFSFRSLVGRVFRLDGPSARPASPAVPEELAHRSLTPPGTPEGPFTTLYVLPTEAAYHALNATVDAVLVVALTPTAAGHRAYWATYLKPVGRITAFYMGLIDPFRRRVVYPGLESWLKRAWIRDRSVFQQSADTGKK